MSQQLPTFTVSDAQAQRLMRTFGSPAAYKAWLRRQVAAAVRDHEAREREQRVKDYIASLDPVDDIVLDEEEETP